MTPPILLEISRPWTLGVIMTLEHMVKGANCDLKAQIIDHNVFVSYLEERGHGDDHIGSSCYPFGELLQILASVKKRWGQCFALGEGSY